jgi:predicted aldo/keto reductase-like oxidoreductase
VGGFKFARDNDIAIIATDCTKAGRLLNNIPENVQAIWDQSQPVRTPEEWRLRWALNFKEVSSVLLDFMSVQHVKDCLSCAEGFSAGGADVWESLQATKVREAYYANRFIQCTSCRCCMPCPLGIDAPRIIELYNDGEMLADDRIPRLLFNKENHQNIECSQCGLCRSQCPKHYPIADIVAGARRKYSDKLRHLP